MNNITKYNLKTFAISAVGLILLFCVLSYVMAPETEGFEFSSINPVGFIEGTIFALGFGLGVPVWISVPVMGIVCFCVWLGFLWIARKIVK